MKGAAAPDDPLEATARQHRIEATPSGSGSSGPDESGSSPGLLSDALLGAPRRPHLEPPPPPAAELLDTTDEPPPAIAVPPPAPPRAQGAPRAAAAHAPAEKAPPAEPPVAAQGHSSAEAPPIAPARPGAIAEHVRQAARPSHGIAAPAARAHSEAPAPVAAETHDAGDVGHDDGGQLPPLAPPPAPEIAGSTQPVRFAPGEDAEKTAAAETRLDAFTGESHARMSALRGLVDGGARSLVPKLAAAEQAIDAAARQNQRAVVAAMADLRREAEAKVRAAHGEILASHGRALVAIRGTGAAAQAQLDAQIEAALAAIAAAEAKSAPQVDAAYAAGDARFRATGEKVGREVLAVGAEYRQNWLAQLDGKSTLLSGPVHDNKLKARAKAADQTAEAYRKELVASAGKQADAAKAGKAHDREALASSAAAHRDAILDVQRDAHAGLAHAEASALDAADRQRDRDLQLLGAQRDVSLRTIARKERELGREVGKHAATQKRALRGFVDAAVSHCLAGLRGMGEAHEGSMRDLRARAATAAAPDVEALEPALAGQRAMLGDGAAATEARLRDALATAAQQIATTQAESVQGLGGFAAMVRQAAGQIGASVAQTIAAFTRHSGEGLASVEKGHAEAARGVVGGAVRASRDIAASSATAVAGLIGHLGAGFDKSAEGLEASLRGALKDLRPQIEKNAEEADKQVQPRWKKVLKVLAVIAVIVVVAVVAGPAVIGAVGAMAGALGASAAVAGAIGTIVGGAVVGAASGAVLQITNNVIDGNKWYEGVGAAAAMGAISGVFGGVGGLAAKGLTSVAIRTLVAMGFDTAGSVVANLATGQPITLEGLAVGLAIGVGVSAGTGALGRFGKRVATRARALRSRSDGRGPAAPEEHVLEIQADTLAGERPSPKTPERANPPAPLEMTEVDGADIPRYQDPRAPTPEFTGHDVALRPVEELEAPALRRHPTPRGESADYMKEQLPPSNQVEAKIKPPKVTAFGGDEPTVEMAAVKPGGEGGGPTHSRARTNELGLDDALESLETEQIGAARSKPASPEVLDTRLQAETDPRKRLELWRELHTRRVNSAASASIHESSNDASLGADQRIRRMEAADKIMTRSLEEIDEEIAHLEAEWAARPDHENLARVNELIERTSLEHAIETRHNVNITNDVDANAGSVHPDYEPTTRASWSMDELRAIDAGLGRLPPEHILGNRLLPPRRLPDGRFDSRMPGLEIRRGKVLREFIDGRWQEVPTSGAAHRDGVIRVFEDASGRNAGKTDRLAGHEPGRAGANGPTAPLEDAVVHEVGHDVEDLHGKRDSYLASEPASVSEAFRAAGGWSTKSMTRQEALEAMVAAPPAGHGMSEAEAMAELARMEAARGEYNHYETPREATGDKVFQVNPYEDNGYISRARNALPEARFDDGYWTYARAHPAETFAEQYSAAVHSPTRYHIDMIEGPARNVAAAHKALEAARAGVASARTGAEAQRAQAQLANAQAMVERATTAQAARQKQYDLMRNTVFGTGDAAAAAEARLAATPVAAGREAERAARIAKFRAEVEIAATPAQVERLRAKAQADIEALN